MSTLAQKVLARLQEQEALKAQQTRVDQPIEAVDAVDSPAAPDPDTPPAAWCPSVDIPGLARAEDTYASNGTEKVTQPSTPSMRPWWMDEHGRCRCCRERKAWRSIHDVVVCGLCHPPPRPELVAAWVNIDPGESHGAAMVQIRERRNPDEL